MSSENQAAKTDRFNEKAAIAAQGAGERGKKLKRSRNKKKDE